MITLLTGENSFDVERALSKIVDDFESVNGKAEKIEAEELRISGLPDILIGVSLFSQKRLVIMRGLSDNKSVWTALADWIPKISDDTNLVLIEPKPDKRTATYKLLKEKGKIHEFQPWTDRDVVVAEKWVEIEAKNQGVRLDKKCVQFLVQWVGVDQWMLFHALEKLALTDEITTENIKDIIEPNPVENALNLFETAINSDTETMNQMLKTLKQTEDVYKLAGLLSSQVFQLAAVATASKSDNLASDFAIHPYVVSKLSPIAKRIGGKGAFKLVSIFAELDDDMKLSKADPWLLVERALVKIANA
jgi:DNA polymerase-3 subunit delta